MTRPTRPTAVLETTPMPLVDCPLCDHPAPIDLVTAELECAPCGIVLEVAADPIQLDLPLAA